MSCNGIKPGVDVIGVSAGAVVYDDEGKIFMAQRSENARDDHGTWEFPGGSVGLHETREEALHRIMKEKYDIGVKIKRVLGVYDVIDRARGDHWLSTTYICRLIDGEAKILDPNKCLSLGWFFVDDILSMNLSRITQLNLKDLKNDLIRRSV